MPVRPIAASLPGPGQQGLPAPTLRLSVLLSLVQQSLARSAAVDDLKDPRTSNLVLPRLAEEVAEVEVGVVAVDEEAAAAYSAAVVLTVAMIDSTLSLAIFSSLRGSILGTHVVRVARPAYLFEP